MKRSLVMILALIISLTIYAIADAEEISPTHIFQNNTTANAEEINRNFQDICSQINRNMPAGVVLPFLGTMAPPGWLLCDGKMIGNSISEGDYKGTHLRDLFNLLKNVTPNEGDEDFDNNATVELPDLRGRTVIGMDNMGGTGANRVTSGQADVLGGNAGEEEHTLTIAEMPRHRHGASGWAYWGPSDPTIRFVFNQHKDQSTQYTNYEGGSDAHNNMPPYMALNYIIKY